MSPRHDGNLFWKKPAFCAYIWQASNLEMLNSALGQSGWEKGAVAAENWQEYVLACLAQLEWQRVVEDVQRFLMNQEELAEFKREVIEELLAR